MLGSQTYAALLPQLREEWGMSNAQAGVVGGMFFAGYIGTVSYWTALTDRIDGRRVYLIGGLLAAAGGLGFGFAASGFYSAIFFQSVLGVGVAATYMPGLRILSDRVSGPNQSRYIAFYTSFFGIGTALSLAIAGMVAPLWGWPAAFMVSALGPLAAGISVFFMIDAKRAPRHGEAFSWRTLFPVSAWRKVLAIRAAAGYTAGYFVHCLELFGSRAWMVAFLAFSAGLHAGEATFPWQLPAIAAVVNLVSVPASIVGNEIALRIGRQKWITIAMAGSGSFGILLGFSAPWFWAVVLAIMIVYGMLVMAESATMTAGLIAVAPPELRGAAMGLYSLVGFGGGMLGPMVYGVALDAAGGAGSPQAWIAGYAAIGLGCLAAPLVVRMK
jgi:MFS family permease